MQRRITFCVLTVVFFSISILGIYAQSTAFSDKGVHSGFIFSDNTALPPTINPPVYLEGGRLLSFYWESSIIDDIKDLSYEFNIYQKDSLDRHEWNMGLVYPLHQYVTKTTSYEYNPSMPALNNGVEYVVVINLLANYGNHSKRLSGIKNAYHFTYSAIPECLPPTKIKVSGVGTDNFKIEWNGPEAEPNGIRYVLRYRAVGQGTDWKEILIEEGKSHSFSQLSNYYQYEIEVRKICPEKSLEPEIESTWEKK